MNSIICVVGTIPATIYMTTRQPGVYKMSEYIEIKQQYVVGLITRAEANARIAILNMGSDSNYFPNV